MTKNFILLFFVLFILPTEILSGRKYVEDDTEKEINLFKTLVSKYDKDVNEALKSLQKDKAESETPRNKWHRRRKIIESHRDQSDTIDDYNKWEALLKKSHHVYVGKLMSSQNKFTALKWLTKDEKS